MITIYHNPRCSKSREGLQILENSGKEFEVIKYLDESISEKKLKEIIKMLDIQPIDLVRTNETIWKSEFKGKNLSNEEIISAMVKHPKLIERPIVIKNNMAVIGRPSDKIKSLIN